MYALLPKTEKTTPVPPSRRHSDSNSRFRVSRRGDVHIRFFPESNAVHTGAIAYRDRSISAEAVRGELL